MQFEHYPSRVKLARFRRRLNAQYAHIVVPTSLTLDEAPALTLGMELAAIHDAKLSVLHIWPPAGRTNSTSGLDALTLLHDAADMIRVQLPTPDNCDSGQARKSAVTAFLNRVVPDDLLQEVEVHMHCRTGDFADTTAGFARESNVDLVIVPAEASRWWSPTFPAHVRRLLKITRQQIILVRPAAPPPRGGNTSLPMLLRSWLRRPFLAVSKWP